MGKVVVKGGTIKCSHGGELTLQKGASSLTVGGNAVVTSGMEAGLTFGSPTSPAPGMVSPCNAQTPSTPPAYVPCVTTPAVAGLAQKLFVGTMPVLLDSANGTTVSGAGPGTWSIGDTGQKQTKLEAA